MHDPSSCISPLYPGTIFTAGGDINGEAAEDQSGRSISLSSDGSRVAIGAHQNNATGVLAGHVRVFELTDGIWIQLGCDIDGEAAGDRLGDSFGVYLSSDGSRVSVGSLVAGYVQVYEFDSEAEFDDDGDGICDIGDPDDDNDGVDDNLVRQELNV